MADSNIAPPQPRITAATAPFYDGAREQRLMIQRCADCGTYQGPGCLLCEECLADDPAWVRATGRGVVFSFTVIHQRYHPAFAAQTPYNVAIVELEEGPRLVSRIVGIEHDAITVGMPVVVCFPDPSASVPLPEFRSTTD